MSHSEKITTQIILVIILALSISNYAYGDPHTELTPITSARWTTPIPAVPVPLSVSKNDYRNFIDQTYASQAAYINTNAGSNQISYQYQWACYAVSYLLITNDADWATLAMRCVRGDLAYRTSGPGATQNSGFNVMAQAAWVVHNLHNSPHVSSQDKEDMRLWMFKLEERMAQWELGAMNRSIGSALGRELMAKLWPADPDAVSRQTYADTVWNSWWTHGDIAENSDNYCALDMQYIIWWIDIKGNSSIYSDNKMINLADRFLEYATPVGCIPHFGDGCGWNTSPGTWIFLMEKWAAVYNDGRFRWIANRIFEWTLDGESEMWQWGNINYDTMRLIMNAHLVSNDSITPVKPSSSSLLSYRKKLLINCDMARDDSGYYSLVTEYDMPDKIIFRTGWEPEATMTMIELCTPTEHCHNDTGSINSMIHGGSMLLTAPGYQSKDHSMHNAFIVKPLVAPSGVKEAGWHFGAQGKLSQNVAAGKLQISFYAKSISGSRYLACFRPWGGGYSYTIEITPDWEQYFLEIDIDYSMQYIFINPLVSLSEEKIADSEFLIDNVQINREGVSENLFINSDFELNLSDWNSTDSQIVINRETSDTYASSNGALRVQVNTDVACIENTTGLEVEKFSKAASTGYTRLKMEHYTGKDVDVSREVFFLGNKGLWVRDSLVGKNNYQAQIGPAWQVVNTYGQQGSNWVNSCANTIPVPYISLLQYMMQWPNQPEDLLIWFSSNSQAQMTIDDVTNDTVSFSVPVMNVHTKRVWQRQEVSLSNGQSHHFNSVLMPHKPTDDASTLASTISILQDTADTSILQIEEKQPWLRSVFAMNSTGAAQTLDNGNITTDAKQFKIVYGLNGIEEYWLSQGTYLTQNGVTIFSSANRDDIYHKGLVASTLTNLALNPSLDAGVDNCTGYEDGTVEASIVSWETTDTYDSSAGALKVSLAPGTELWACHKTGAKYEIQNPTGTASKLRVEFYAKSLSGSDYVCISRLWGGERKYVRITDQWEQYAVELVMHWDSNDLIFSTVQSLTSSKAADGVFLMDDVSVTSLPNNLENKYFEDNLKSWKGYCDLVADNSILYWDPSDNYGNSNGAMRVKIDLQGGENLYSHKSGASCTVKSIPAGAGVRVSFMAKSLSGSNFLNIERTYGGGRGRVEISSSWKQYEIDISTPYQVDTLLFSTVVSMTCTGFKNVVDGEFLLDYVHISSIPAE